jgi:hypothetical protein
MSIKDTLINIKNTDMSVGSNFANESKVYDHLLKCLPKKLLRPDKFTLDTVSGITDLVNFYYILKPGEKAEPIKMVLSMVFGVKDWVGVFNKKTNTFKLEFCKVYDNLILMVSLEADLRDYFFNSKLTKGDIETGPIELKKFIPYDLKREIITPLEFELLQAESGLSSVIFDWWISALDTLITSINNNIPDTSQVQGMFNSAEHDVNFIYSADPLGLIQASFDDCIPDLKWTFTWIKRTGICYLTTDFLVTNPPNSVNVLVTIQNPAIYFGKLSLLTEDFDSIIYNMSRNYD